MYFNKYILLFFVFLNLFFCRLNGQEVEIVTDKNSTYFGCLKIINLNEKELFDLNKNDLIKIYPAELFVNKKDDLPSMLGEVILENDTIYFRPRFPFRPNKKYVVEIGRENKYAKEFLIPEMATHQPTYVNNFSPKSSVWPANQLKVYIYFSAPMGLGNIYEHIKLLDENGEEVEKPFLEITPPLWDKNQQRLTLWFDPGRIKRHLSPNEKMGPPLEENKNYTLVVSQDATDALGQKLKREFEKHFTTAENDREKPDPSKWEMIFPNIKRKEKVAIMFHEPLDRGTLESAIGIIDANRNPVSGHVEILKNESAWLFFPEHRWQSGEYKLIFSEKLEDLAGNNLKRLFDVDYQEEAENKSERPVLEFPFYIKE